MRNKVILGGSISTTHYDVKGQNEFSAIFQLPDIHYGAEDKFHILFCRALSEILYESNE